MLSSQNQTKNSVSAPATSNFGLLDLSVSDFAEYPVFLLSKGHKHVKVSSYAAPIISSLVLQTIASLVEIDPQKFFFSDYSQQSSVRPFKDSFLDMFKNFNSINLKPSLKSKTVSNFFLESLLFIVQNVYTGASQQIHSSQTFYYLDITNKAFIKLLLNNRSPNEPSTPIGFSFKVISFLLDYFIKVQIDYF